MSSYTLNCPATNPQIGNLMLVIMNETTSLDDRIELCFGTCALQCQDESEREEHGGMVTVRHALTVLLCAMFPDDDESNPGDDEASE